MILDRVLPPDPQIDPVSPSELKLLKEQASESWSGQRDRLIMDTMFVAGLRSNEITGLKRSNLDADKDTIDVTPAKFDSERRLSLDDGLVDRLVDFVEVSPESEYVFPDAEGGKLSTRYMRSFVNTYAEEAGLSPDRIHPHLFRHTFASMLLETSKNLRLVQRALGHDSLQTTLIYVHTIPDETRDFLTIKDGVNLSQFVSNLPPAD